MARRMIIGLLALLLAGCATVAEPPVESALPPAPQVDPKPQPVDLPEPKTADLALVSRYRGALADLRAKRYAEAESTLAQLLSERPESGLYHLAHGVALLGLEQREAAAAACQAAAERQMPGAEGCLTDLRSDLPSLPAGEENLGEYQWDAHRGYRWHGPNRTAKAEFIRVSPPTICAYRQVDGFWSYNYTCGGDGRVFQWAFEPPFAGRSPGGVGLDTPLTEVEARWGKGLTQPEGSCYYATSLRLCLQPTQDQQRVGRILITRRGLAHFVPALYYRGTKP